MTKAANLTRRKALIAGGVAMAAAAFPPSVDAAWTRKEWGATEKRNVDVVRKFWATLEAGDVDAHFALIADDARLRNTAHTPAAPQTPEARRKVVIGYLKPRVIKVKTLDIVAQGPMVIDTRIDRVVVANGVRQFHYMGVYFLKDGKIQEWSDYEVAPERPVKPGEPL